MSRSAPQPDHAAVVIQELLEWVPKNCISGTNGPSAEPNRPFMPLPDLEAYLKAHRRTSKLLRASYPERDHLVVASFLEEWYIRVFTILILIGKGNYIEHFYQHTNLRDHKLPFLEKPAHFPIDPSDPTFWESFYEKQFIFCAHCFGHNENYIKLEDPCVLPITSKELLGRGGSAAIYKIRLHPYYDRLLSEADCSMIQAHGRRPANTYVLKTYNTKDAQRYWENEVDAFRKLATKERSDQSLIGFLGSYKQGDTYNMLLEYADRGTLEEFFRSVAPPSLGGHIVMFWDRLFNVLKALSRVHATERPDGFRGPDILIGWHQDVKPSNILVVSGKSSHPYDVEFRLADLGLSHFKRTEKLDRKIVDSDIGGTKDYGAPECYRSDEFLEQLRINVKPSVDVWSFGGVCSEAAVWVVLGTSGLDDYRYQRQQEIVGKNTIQDGSPFHDGEKILEAVEAVHDRLLKRGEVRPGDHITKPALIHMVRSMLEEDPDIRHNAAWLWKFSRKLVKDAQLELEASDQPQTPRKEDATVSKVHYFGQNLPDTPPRTSYNASQPYNGDPHAHGPPPNYPQYNSSFRNPGRPLSGRDLPKQRSDTWHESNTRVGMSTGSPNGILSSPIAIRQAPEGSPPPDTGSIFKEPTQISPVGLNETTTRPGGRFQHDVAPLSYSPPSVLRDVETLDIAANPHRSMDEFSPLEEDVATQAQFVQQTQTEAGLEPMPVRSMGAYRPLPEPYQQHAETVSKPTGYETAHPTAGTASNETTPNLVSKTPRSPPEATVTPAKPPIPKPKAEKPYLSYKVAKQIRERRGALPKYQHALLNDLKGRDHVFLMDDSSSMKEHWDDVVSLFSVFAYFVKRLDDDGLEMYFTVSEHKESFKDTSPAVSHLKSMRPGSASNIDIRLGKILGKYQTDLEDHKHRRAPLLFRAKPVKHLSLYVFTDAAWPGSDAVAPVEAMIEKQMDLRLPKHSVAIQFIRFGDDPTGIDRLRYLDSGLRKKYGKKHDIVDTEPFQNGNLLKMLLGAVSDWFDDDEDEPD